MNREEYAAAAMELYKKPPSKIKPKGQKFNIGDTVITNQGFWGDDRGEVDEFGFDKNGFYHPPSCHDKGRKAVIEYSYWQKYCDTTKTPSVNNGNLKQYSIRFIDTDRKDDTSAWWDEYKLTLIKSVSK